jgi:hypothetical protein
MSLHGVVTSSESALTQDLVPALVFTPMASIESTTTTSHFVKGEVEGIFPSSFTMRIYEPPPDETLQAMLDGEPRLTFANITAVSAEHPRWLRTTQSEEPWLVDGVEVGTALHNELCDDTGRCITGVPAECPEGQQDPSAQWPCGASFPDDLPWESYGYSMTYAVVYFDGDVAAGSVLSKVFGDGSAIAGGYHAMRYVEIETLPDQELTARHECEGEAWMQAHAATNAIYGTMDVYPNLVELATDERLRELSQQNMIALAELGCEPSMLLVDDSEMIELPFTDQPQSFTF